MKAATVDAAPPEGEGWRSKADWKGVAHYVRADGSTACSDQPGPRGRTMRELFKTRWRELDPESHLCRLCRKDHPRECVCGRCRIEAEAAIAKASARSPAVVERAIRAERISLRYRKRCRYCRDAGHNSATCPTRAEVIASIHVPDVGVAIEAVIEWIDAVAPSRRLWLSEEREKLLVELAAGAWRTKLRIPPPEPPRELSLDDRKACWMWGRAVATDLLETMRLHGVEVDEEGLVDLLADSLSTIAQVNAMGTAPKELTMPRRRP